MQAQSRSILPLSRILLLILIVLADSLLIVRRLYLIQVLQKMLLLLVSLSAKTIISLSGLGLVAIQCHLLLIFLMLHQLMQVTLAGRIDMDCARFGSFCACGIERLYCYGKARSFFFPTYEQFLIFAQLVDHHAFDSAKIFINRTNDDFLTFYYIVLEKLVQSDSSYADLLAYTKNRITSVFLDYYRKGVK